MHLMRYSGLYTVSDVARYSKVPATTLRTWFFPRSDNQGLGPVFIPEYMSFGSQPVLSFLNLVEARAARVFRKMGVKSGIIRRAREVLEKDLGTRHPFAHYDIRTNGKRLYRQVAEEMEDSLFRDVISGQTWIKEFEAGLVGVDYSEETKMASRLKLDSGVILDPNHSAGQPIAPESLIPTSILASVFKASNRDACRVADWYSIPVEDVELAVQFEAA